MADVVLAVEGLSRSFGTVRAVEGLSFEVRAGEIFGLLGPNGAGKTTTLRMITGQLAPDAGTVRIHGRLLGTDPADRARVGHCPQELVLFEKLTCLEQLEFVGEMYGLSRTVARGRGAQLLGELGLGEKAAVLAGALSGGMKRRLNLALALVHDPELVVLDEPEAGLDPQSRLRVRDYLRSLAHRRTVLLTTHDMDEAERLADRVAVVDHGRLLVCDSPQALEQRLGTGEVLELRLPEAAEGPAARALQGLPGLSTLAAPGLLTVRTEQAARALPQVLDRLAAAQIVPGDVRLRSTSLEDVFIGLTGRALRESGEPS